MIVLVEGTSDDIDEVIKPCFMDADFVAKHRLCSINSINWARVLVQTAHYFYAYFQVSLAFWSRSRGLTTIV